MTTPPRTLLPLIFVATLLGPPPLSLTQSLAQSLAQEANSPPVVPEGAVDLRNVGLAQLENERPEKAEESYRRLVEIYPQDPLGYGNLAIALLRQQKFDEAMATIAKAVQRAPERGDLLAIQGDIQQWSGDLEGALESYRAAAAATPEDPEILYALYRHTETLESEAAQEARGWALARLVKLRPENVVTLLAQGKAAIQRGDRAAATGAFLRIQELLWQAEPMAERAMGLVLEALKKPDVSGARVPALRLENVLKVTPMYRESLRELVTGIQGIPVETFQGEVPAGSFGAPADVRFSATAPRRGATPARGVVRGDFDGNGSTDFARLVVPEDGEEYVEISLQDSQEPHQLALPKGQMAEGAAWSGLATFDLNNDGHLDLLAYAADRLRFWHGVGEGGFTEATAAMGLEGRGATAVVALDFDIEGDLDLVLFTGEGERPAELLYNNLQGPLQPVGEKVFPPFGEGQFRDGARVVLASDFDRDGDLDLLFGGEGGLVLLDNLRQGRFEDRTEDRGLAGCSPVLAAHSADLNNDGLPEIVTAGEGLRIWQNGASTFESLGGVSPSVAPVHHLEVADFNNDGRLDLALAGARKVEVLSQRESRKGNTEWHTLPVETSEVAATALQAADVDNDGDLDLLLGTASPTAGFSRRINEGGNRNGWLSIRLRGLDKGNSKNNSLGLGTTVEVLAGSAYQFREATADVVHFGLGDLRRAYLTRVVWTNGVPQQRLLVQGNQRIVEEQLLKGSCPFLYSWDGERMAFVTDLLWGAPLGLPLAPGKWIPADPGELVEVVGARPDSEGLYQLRITEELWEAAFFDHVRLWVVDHPAEVEVASTLRIVPGEILPEGILGSRDLRPVRAWDGQGREVTSEVAHRDDVYADGFTPSRYQGVARKPWNLTLDLGPQAEALQGESVRLVMDGWIFPADASLNLAVAQRDDLIPHPPRLEVEVGGTWQTLMPAMGFPAGKTKTMVVDTPPLPPGAHRLRIVTGQWLSWDRIAWTTASGRADHVPKVVAKLDPTSAELRYRGFSALVRKAPNAPHGFDYQQTSTESPWLPFPGPYTRYGGVEELLDTVDDRNVILAPGDEIALAFDGQGLPPVAPGWQRTLFLESHGWDKDADRNTWRGEGVEPLPLTELGGYPPDPDAGWEEPEWMEEYRRQWLTRVVE